jgi:hypothetical protein
MTPIAGGDGRPPEPDWRTLFSNEDDVAVAHERWGIIIREMSEAGTLTVANGDAIRRLIEFRVQYERAARHVAEKGPILQTSKMKSKTGQWNPYWSVMRQAGDSIARLRLSSAFHRSAAARSQRSNVSRKRRGQPTTTSKRLPDDPTTRWARDVVDGRIVAGELVAHAAERHLRDLRDRDGKDLFWRS